MEPQMCRSDISYTSHQVNYCFAGLYFPQNNLLKKEKIFVSKVHQQRNRTNKRIGCSLIVYTSRALQRMWPILIWKSNSVQTPWALSLTPVSHLRWRQLSRWSTAPRTFWYVGQIARVAGNDAAIVEEIGNQFLPSRNITPFLSSARTGERARRLWQRWQK